MGLSFYYVNKWLGKEVKGWSLELQMKNLKKVNDLISQVSLLKGRRENWLQKEKIFVD